MNILKKFLIICLPILMVSSAFITSSAETVDGTVDIGPLKPPFWQYSAKFVCGPLKGDADVVTGVYRTTINIHNTYPNKAIEFRKKAVVAFSERQKNSSEHPVLISPYHGEFLIPDDAMGVNCDDIRSLFPQGTSQPPSHFEGFLVIQVPDFATTQDPLDVVGKYSARPSTGEVSTLDVVQVPAKHFP